MRVDYLNVQVDGQVHKVPTASGAKGRRYTKEQCRKTMEIFQNAIDSQSLSKHRKKRFIDEAARYKRMIQKMPDEPKKAEETQETSYWSYLNPWAYL